MSTDFLSEANLQRRAVILGIASLALPSASGPMAIRGEPRAMPPNLLLLQEIALSESRLFADAWRLPQSRLFAGAWRLPESTLFAGARRRPESERLTSLRRPSQNPRIELHNDVGSLLFDQLVPAWRSHGVTPISGLTSVPTFFCLAQVAADHGLRLVYRGIHQPVTRGLRHQTRGLLETFRTHSTRWPVEIAQALQQELRRPPNWQTLSPHEVLPSADSGAVSWLMMPRATFLQLRNDHTL